jgi:hypothetical protein
MTQHLRVTTRVVAAVAVAAAVLGGATAVVAGQDPNDPRRVTVDSPEKQRLLDEQIGRTQGGNAPENASADLGKLPVPVVGDADAPWPLGIFTDEEAPFPLMEFTPVTNWVGIVGNQYVVLYTGSETETPANGSARLMHYSISDGSLVSASVPAVPAGEGVLTITTASATEVGLVSANGTPHTFNIVTGQFL